MLTHTPATRGADPAGSGDLTGADVEKLFTHEQPLGPIAISDETRLNTLQALYDSRVNLHVQSEHNPPTFIVGRRGSGKTSLLLSREFDRENVAIRLSTADLFGHLQTAVDRLGRHNLLTTVEVVARLWDAILWAPIAVRLAGESSVQSEGAAFQTVWEETARMRALEPTRRRSSDDVVIGHFAERLIEFIEGNPRCRTVDAVTSAFQPENQPWSRTIDACQQLLDASRLPVFVLMDSLEDVGPLIERLRPTLRGLFHLVGQTRLGQAFRYYRIQCCFPSELWPLLDNMSSNPVKDLSGRLVLQWQWHDLLSACDNRLRMYLNLHDKRLLESAQSLAERGLIYAFLPPTVTSRTGRTEETIPYILRHTQLLPRQVLYILNECFARAIAEKSQPYPSPRNVVDAVGAVEATLCPEVFSAHSFRYRQAEQIAARMVPRLPFRFSEGALHKAYNQSGAKSLGLDYDEVRQMLTDIGVVGRFTDETDRYIRAEFAYSLEGQLILSPDDELCLHPMFVRQFSSTDLLPGRPAPKPVYPIGTPESTQ